MAAKRCLLNSSPVLRMTCQMKRNKEDSPFQLASPLTRSALPGRRDRRPSVRRGSRLRGIVASRAAVESCVRSKLKHPSLTEPPAASAVARSCKLQSCRRRRRPDQVCVYGGAGGTEKVQAEVSQRSAAHLDTPSTPHRVRTHLQAS